MTEDPDVEHMTKRLREELASMEKMKLKINQKGKESFRVYVRDLIFKLYGMIDEKVIDKLTDWLWIELGYENGND